MGRDGALWMRAVSGAQSITTATPPTPKSCALICPPRAVTEARADPEETAPSTGQSRGRGSAGWEKNAGSGEGERRLQKVFFYLKNDKILITSSQLNRQTGGSDKCIKHQKAQDGERCWRAPNIDPCNVIHS